MKETMKVPGSFRDPSGYLFVHEQTLYRRVNQAYESHYQKLNDSGLYERLIKRGLLIPHSEVGADDFPDKGDHHWRGAYKVLKPDLVPFISYPYEWSFSQLKDAALATLSIQKEALKHGMILKDASAYNIQFHQGRALLIDSLSLETYEDGEPWQAYKQFCQHFLGPLALMSYGDVRHVRLSSLYIDGVPLDLVSKLLPTKTKFKYGLLTHLHIHAATLRRYSAANPQPKKVTRKISAQSLEWINESLINVVTKLQWHPQGTEWAEYYSDLSYTDDSQEHKLALVERFLSECQPGTVWDLGANTGRFSRLASKQGIATYAFDIDPACVEKNYLESRKDKERHLTPLLMDLANPSSALGWANQERMSLLQRGPVDMVLALALIHHLAISNNVPLTYLAEFFASLCRELVIEFVPKEDPMVQSLLASRKDIFDHYDLENFEAVFTKHFTIKEKVQISGSPRTLFLLVNRTPK